MHDRRRFPPSVVDRYAPAALAALFDDDGGGGDSSAARARRAGAAHPLDAAAAAPAARAALARSSVAAARVLVVDERDAAPDSDTVAVDGDDAAALERARAAWRPRDAQVYARLRELHMLGERGGRDKRVVNARWVYDSVKRSQLLPADAHSPYCVLKPQEAA